MEAGTVRFWRAVGALAFLALALHLLLYLPSYPHLFSFDDRQFVLEDPDVRGEGSLLHVFARPYSLRPGQDYSYRPAALFSLGLDARVFGLAPGPMRLENILLAALGATAMGALALLFEAPPLAAAAVVVLLSCHPVRSEAIVTIVGRSELLAFLFLTVSLAVAKGSWRRRSSVAAAALSALLLLAGLLSKESAYAAPFLLAGLVALEPREGWKRRVAPVVMGWSGALALGLVMRRLAIGGFLKGPGAAISPFDNPLAALPALERFRGAVALLPTAVLRLLWPATLVGDYGSRSFSSSELSSAGSFAAGLALLAAAAAPVAFLARRGGRWRIAAYGTFWAAVSYVPFANVLFVTGTAFAERLLYAPAAGVALALGPLLVAGRARVARLAGGLAVLALSAAGALRIDARLPEWRDDETLFRSVVRDRPGNGRAWFDLALIDLSRRDAPAARRDLEAALRADPALARDARGHLRHAAQLGRPEEESAIRGALEAIQRP